MASQSITGLEFDTREFERAMADISSESDRTDFEIVTMNSRTYLRAIVYNTPIDEGAGRAGFWAAWEALENPGTPGTRRGKAPFKLKKNARDKYVPDGTAIDKRRDRGERSFEFINRTHVVRYGKKIHYLYVLNARTDFWGKGAEEATYKFGKGYERLLKKHSKI